MANCKPQPSWAHSRLPSQVCLFWRHMYTSGGGRSVFVPRILATNKQTLEISGKGYLLAGCRSTPLGYLGNSDTCLVRYNWGLFLKLQEQPSVGPIRKNVYWKVSWDLEFFGWLVRLHDTSWDFETFWYFLILFDTLRFHETLWDLPS